MLNTKIGENYNANDVINSNDLRKRIINVDSRFRDVCSESPTNFTYQLEHTYKNVIRARVASIEIPNMFYTFSKAKKNLSFVVKAYDISNNPRAVVIELEQGNYTSAEIISEIQTMFDERLRIPYGIFLTVMLNTNNAKISIQHNGVSAYPVTSSTVVPTANARPFILDFLVEPCMRERLHNFGLGYNLGFRNKVYKVMDVSMSPEGLMTYSIVAEGCLDVVGDTYLLLSINDLHTVEQKTKTNYIQCLAKVIVREEKYAVIYDDGGTLLSNDVIFPSPVDLSRLQIKLMDPYGDIIDLCGMNFSFSLEITEVLNTRLYDFYRNYIWLGSVPSVPKGVTGSAQPLLKGIGPPF
jgi:hypothetical protein